MRRLHVAPHPNYNVSVARFRLMYTTLENRTSREQTSTPRDHRGSDGAPACVSFRVSTPPVRIFYPGGRTASGHASRASVKALEIREWSVWS